MKREKFKGKIYSKSFLLWYRILIRVKNGLYGNQIARQLSLPRKNIEYHLKRMEKLGLIKRNFRSSFVSYSLTPEGEKFLKEFRNLQKKLSAKNDEKEKFSLPMRERKNVRLHNLAIKFSILKDNPQAKLQKSTEINNWIKQYSVVTFPIGLTIEKTTKHVIIYFHQFQTNQKTFLSDFFNWVIRGIYYTYYYLKKEYDIVIDIFQGEIIREHIANESPEFNEKIDKKKTVEVKLGRKAKFIYPANFEAKAWIDRSLGDVEIETNDMIYEEKLLLMPEIIWALDKKLVPVLNNLAEQINLHLQVMKDIRDGIRILNKHLKELKKGGD